MCNFISTPKLTIEMFDSIGNQLILHIDNNLLC